MDGSRTAGGSGRGRGLWRLGSALGALAVCAVFGTSAGAGERSYHAPIRIGTVTDSRIEELSGMVAVTERPDAFWAVNDSDNTSDLFAVRTDGVILGVVRVQGATNTDWEDIAKRPGGDGEAATLYIADTGDNGRVRSEVVIWSIPEPVLPAGAGAVSAPATALRFRYPDGAHDVEALVVVPGSGELLVIGKEAAPAPVWRVPTAAGTGDALVVAELVGQLSLPGLVTAADISRDGSRLLVRTFDVVAELEAWPEATLEQLLRAPPALLPDAGPAEPKSEAIAFLRDESGFWTTNELDPIAIHVTREAVLRPVAEVAPTVVDALSFLRGDVVEEPGLPAVLDAADAAAIALGRVQDACLDRCDVDDDGDSDLDDATGLLDALVDASRVAEPEGAPGPDPTADPRLCGLERVAELLGSEAEWRWLSSDEGPTGDWREMDYDDGDWGLGSGGVGFGREGLGATISPAAGSRRRLLLRAAFEVADPGVFDALLLEIDRNDGFVAWLDGVEVARRDLGEPGFDPPPELLARVHAGEELEELALSAEPLRAGRNVLAIEVRNRSATDSTLWCDARLSGARLVGQGPGEAPEPSVASARLWVDGGTAPAPGDSGELRILADSEAPILAGTILLRYDTADLRLSSVQPGAAVLATPGAWATGRVSSARRELALAFLVDPAALGPGALEPGGMLEIARARYQVRATETGVTRLEFAPRILGRPLSTRLIDASGAVVPVETEDLDLPIEESLSPRIESVVGNEGAPGRTFFVIGFRFDEPGLEVRLCDRPAVHELIGSDTLRVFAPECDRTGPVDVEVCTEHGCDVAEGAFAYLGGAPWARGDANGDLRLDISDAIAILAELFLGEPSTAACPEARDANADGREDISDAVFVLAFLFQGGVEIAPPGVDTPGSCAR